MKSRIATIALSSALILSGCTCITVTKLSPSKDNSDVKGVRFSLPRPYIQVIPKDDGSISADIVYLPDLDHTYAARSFSLFASDTLDVTTEDGILTQIDWTGDSSAVVSDAIRSSGNVAGEVLKANETKKAEQKTKEDAASKAVDDAQLEFDQAQSRLTILRNANPNDPAAIQQAEIAVDAAQLKLNAAISALARMRGVVTSPKEDAANTAVVDARRMLKMAQNNLTRLMGLAGIPPNDILIAQLLVNLTAFRLWEAQDERDQMMGKPQGQMFGPKLFAIHEEVRKSANDKTTSPFLQIITVQQQADPSPGAGWNSPQPKYPVKWPEAPNK